MALKSKIKIVEDLTVSSPCPDEAFQANAKVLDAGWYCNQCSKEVYDLKKMSRKEISKLIAKKNGNFCAVISRRLDGSLITKEPVSPAHSLMSAGLLLASTTLINSPAIAQSERGDVAAPPVQTAAPTRGEVTIPVETPVSQSPESCSEQSTSSEQPVPTPTQDIHQTAGGISVPMPTRGKVRVEPK